MNIPKKYSRGRDKRERQEERDRSEVKKFRISSKMRNSRLKEKSVMKRSRRSSKASRVNSRELRRTRNSRKNSEKSMGNRITIGPIGYTSGTASRKSSSISEMRLNTLNLGKSTSKFESSKSEVNTMDKPRKEYRVVLENGTVIYMNKPEYMAYLLALNQSREQTFISSNDQNDPKEATISSEVILAQDLEEGVSVSISNHQISVKNEPKIPSISDQISHQPSAESEEKVDETTQSKIESYSSQNSKTQEENFELKSSSDIRFSSDSIQNLSSEMVNQSQQASISEPELISVANTSQKSEKMEEEKNQKVDKMIGTEDNSPPQEQPYHSNDKMIGTDDKNTEERLNFGNDKMIGTDDKDDSKEENPPGNHKMIGTNSQNTSKREKRKGVDDKMTGTWDILEPKKASKRIQTMKSDKMIGTDSLPRSYKQEDKLIGTGDEYSGADSKPKIPKLSFKKSKENTKISKEKMKISKNSVDSVKFLRDIGSVKLSNSSDDEKMTIFGDEEQPVELSNDQERLSWMDSEDRGAITEQRKK